MSDISRKFQSHCFFGYHKLPIPAGAITPGTGFLFQLAQVNGLIGIGTGSLQVRDVASRLLEAQTITRNGYMAGTVAVDADRV